MKSLSVLISACNSIGIKTDVNRVSSRLDMKPYKRDPYIYVHATRCGEIFYIGKGIHIRAFVTHGRSKHWHNKVNKNGIEVFILLSGLSENETLNNEIKIISECKRLGINLVNISGGGDGSPAYLVSDETRKKQSEIKKNAPINPKFVLAGKTSRLGMKNSADHTERTAQARRKKLINSKGEVFNSATEAAKAYGTSQGNISSCASGKRATAYGLAWSYDIDKIPKVIAKNNLKPLIRSDGIIFKSSSDASRYMSIELSRSVPYQSIGESARSNGVRTVFGFSFKFYY